MPDDPATLGYIAGLLDGEGCVTKQNGRWKVQIAMTHEPVIRWLGTMGGTVRERKVNGNRQRTWRWLLMRQIDVRDFLRAMHPLLLVKADHVAAVLAEIDAEGLDDLVAPARPEESTERMAL